jgi:hypothetical protein
MGLNITFERCPIAGSGGQAMKQTYQGSCHCGKVRFEADVDPDGGVRRCNCWICAKQRSMEMLVKAEDFRLLSDEAELGDYPFGIRGGHSLFCRTCGVASFRRGYAETLGGEYVSIASACLNDDGGRGNATPAPARRPCSKRGDPTASAALEVAR